MPSKEWRFAPKAGNAELVALAGRRILSILDKHTVASKRTLESKISEAGPFRQRVLPDLVTTRALPALVAAGQVSEIQSASHNRPAFYALPAMNARHEMEIQKELHRKAQLHALYGEYAKATIGDAAESVFEKAFSRSQALRLLQPVGNVTFYNGITIANSADALVQSNVSSRKLPISAGTALIEIKNRREWTYHDNPNLWELIRCAYQMDVVGVFIARRIAPSAFSYVFKRVGALGIETFFQFAPPNAEKQLGPVKDKHGLGFHDLTFRSDVPPSVQKQIDALGTRIYTARRRMIAVREIVEPFLDVLGNVNANKTLRRLAYKNLDSLLRRHDYPDEQTDDPESDE